jgi:hypothetical protein
VKIVGLLVLSVLASCEIINISPAPYLVTRVSVITGGGDDYRLGAAEVDLLNQAEKEITSLLLEFDLYDINGLAQPRIGKNRVEATFFESIPSGEEISLRIVLDSLFTLPPLCPLTLTRFCLTNIGYADGSVWTDRLKLNLIMEDRVTVVCPGNE